MAIKVLPASVAGDADRLARFQREAEVLAALNHSNIAAPGLPLSTAVTMEGAPMERLHSAMIKDSPGLWDALTGIMRADVVMFAIVFLGWTVQVGHGQSTASLLINGSFEQGPAVEQFLNLDAGNTSLPGWIVTGEGVDYVSRGYWISSDGTRAIDLDGSARSRQTPPYAQGGIAQTFATIPGMRYRVTFDLAGNPNRPPEIKRFQISAAGQSAELSFNAKGKNARNMGWQAATWTFTASAAATTLEFKSLTTSPQTGYGAAIDNVSVVPDKAPALLVRESDTEIQVQLGSEVLFDTGEFDLKPAATSTLEALAALLAKHSTSTVVIEGHTDSVGSPQSNQLLSDNRASAVRQWLVANGIPASRITTKGVGSTAPVATNETAEGRQKNRRVEVRVQK